MAEAGLTRAQLAEFLDEDEDALVELERGSGPFDLALLDRCARAFGTRVDRLLSSQPGVLAGSLLFRAISGAVVSELAARGGHLGIGDFLRTATDLGELAALRARKGATAWRPLAESPSLPRPVPEADPDLYREAEALAYDLRAKLDLGDAPVPSMIALVEDRLQVPIVWSTPDEVDPNIDGASTRTPIPAVLVNLVGGREQWWRTRMTLAHELCHLVFDAVTAPSGPSMVMFSPHREPTRAGAPRVYALPEALERTERRANAFAAHFLAPGRVLRRLVSRHDATSETAITLVCQHFAIGRTTAVNQLTNVFLLSRQERARMLDRSGEESLPRDHPDASVAADRAPRSHTLRRWLEEALARGWLSAIRVRDYVGQAATEAISWPGGDARLRDPVVTEVAAVRLRVHAHLGRQDITAQWRVHEPIADGDRWRVAVFDDQDRPRGTLVLSREREVLEQETRIALSGP